jgi:hypothetical protein
LSRVGVVGWASFWHSSRLRWAGQTGCPVVIAALDRPATFCQAFGLGGRLRGWHAPGANSGEVGRPDRPWGGYVRGLPGPAAQAIT